MAEIEHETMGDVWPVCAPGNANADYGAASLYPTTPCPVRSFQTFEITYTVGQFGLDDTGAIRVALRWVHDGGPLQTSDPSAANYVTAHASNGVTLKVFPEPYAYRPWLLALRVTVTGGIMQMGDTIRIVIGDRAGGSPGFRMQTICEDAFQFKVSVDSCATGQFHPLDDVLTVTVIAGPAHTWHLIAPTLRRPGELFSIGIKAEDFWGNPTTPDCGVLRLRASAPVKNLPDTVTFDEVARGLVVPRLSAADEGSVTFTLEDASGKVLARSNPLAIESGDNAGYWGDLHGQSGETVGVNPIESYLEFARDLAFLDVSGHQANDFQITNAFWNKINATTARMNVDGSFIVFPGYEWSANTAVGGDHNVFFRHEGRQIRRSSHAMLAERSDIATDANTLPELFDSLDDEDCVVFAHFGGRPADLALAHSPKLRTAVEVHSNWGTFEWMLTDSLALGYRVGVVCNSDGHKGRPGASPPGAANFGAYGGLTCFLAPELTRDAIFECLRRRHHYGTTGSRIHLDVRAAFAAPATLYRRDLRHFDVQGETVDVAIMGDIVHTRDDELSLSVSVGAASAVERVDIMNRDTLIATRRSYAQHDLGNRVRVTWQGAEYRGRGSNTHWQGEIAVEGAKIAAMEPVNHWNPERRIECEGDDRISVDAVTSGNVAGVDVRLSEGADAIVKVVTNHVSGQVRVADLDLEDAVFDGGGEGRQIRIRRLPDDVPQGAFAATIPVTLSERSDNALWVRVSTSDGHTAWSSPMYVSRET